MTPGLSIREALMRKAIWLCRTRCHHFGVTYSGRIMVRQTSGSARRKRVTSSRIGSTTLR